MQQGGPLQVTKGTLVSVYIQVDDPQDRGGGFLPVMYTTVAKLPSTCGKILTRAGSGGSVKPAVGIMLTAATFWAVGLLAWDCDAAALWPFPV